LGGALKAVIFAGGRGTRLSEETGLVPKPLVSVDHQPILFHIMANYSRFGVTEFVILTGYKGEEIKKYFDDFWTFSEEITFDLSQSHKISVNRKLPPWKVTVIDTGLETQTGGRLGYLKGRIDEPFFLTYGDGVSDVDLSALLDLHHKSEALVTLTAVQPKGRFGALVVNNNLVSSFIEKPSGDKSWINGGYFVVEPEALNYIKGAQDTWEESVLQPLAKIKKLGAYKHHGCWYPVDTIRDLYNLREAVARKEFPWL